MPASSLQDKRRTGSSSTEANHPDHPATLLRGVRVVFVSIRRGHERERLVWRMRRPVTPARRAPPIGPMT